MKIDKIIPTSRLFQESEWSVPSAPQAEASEGTDPSIVVSYVIGFKLGRESVVVDAVVTLGSMTLAGGTCPSCPAWPAGEAQILCLPSVVPVIT